MPVRHSPWSVRGFAIAIVAIGAVAVVASAVGPASAATGDAVPDAVGLLDNHTVEDAEDPDNETVGWWNGYAYDHEIDVDQSDGLSDDELDAWIARSMARVERIRGLAFEEDVEVEVLSRTEYVEDYVGGPEEPELESQLEEEIEDPGAYWSWNNEVWKALFVVGENEDVRGTFAEVRTAAVGGFYDPRTGQIVVVAEDAEELVVNNATLIHELHHALQDQQFDLQGERFRPDVQDEQLALDGLVEGAAGYVEALYTERCGEEWDCVATPGPAQPRQPPEFNPGVYVTIFQPYSDGPQYVHEIVEEEGWAGIDDRFEAPPNASSEIIHPDREGELPEQMTFEDNARDGWNTFENQGRDGVDVAGEASIFSMFWYQGMAYGNPIVDPRDFLQPEGEYEDFDYSAPPSEGWVNDRLVPYQRDDETGYVWQTEWATEADAGEFREAYRQLLQGHDAERRGDSTWVIRGDKFPGAYHVNQNGTTVTIVHAPEIRDLEDLRPGIGVQVETGAQAASVKRTLREQLER